MNIASLDFNEAGGILPPIGCLFSLLAFHFPRAIATLLPRSDRAAFASLQLLFQDFVLGCEHAMAQLAFGQLNYWQLLFQPWRTIDKNPGGCVFVYDLLLFLWVALHDVPKWIWKLDDGFHCKHCVVYVRDGIEASRVMCFEF